MGSGYFRVDGADLETGEESYVILQAPSVAEAEAVARKQGLLIAGVRTASSADWGVAAPGIVTPKPPARVMERVITFEPVGGVATPSSPTPVAKTSTSIVRRAEQKPVRPATPLTPIPETKPETAGKNQTPAPAPQPVIEARGIQPAVEEAKPVAPPPSAASPTEMVVPIETAAPLAKTIPEELHATPEAAKPQVSETEITIETADLHALATPAVLSDEVVASTGAPFIDEASASKGSLAEVAISSEPQSAKLEVAAQSETNSDARPTPVPHESDRPLIVEARSIFSETIAAASDDDILIKSAAPPLPISESRPETNPLESPAQPAKKGFMDSVLRIVHLGRNEESSHGIASHSASKPAETPPAAEKAIEVVSDADAAIPREPLSAPDLRSHAVPPEVSAEVKPHETDFAPVVVPAGDPDFAVDSVFVEPEIASAALPNNLPSAETIEIPPSAEPMALEISPIGLATETAVFEQPTERESPVTVPIAAADPAVVLAEKIEPAEPIARATLALPVAPGPDREKVNPDVAPVDDTAVPEMAAAPAPVAAATVDAGAYGIEDVDQVQLTDGETALLADIQTTEVQKSPTEHLDSSQVIAATGDSVIARATQSAEPDPAPHVQADVTPLPSSPADLASSLESNLETPKATPEITPITSDSPPSPAAAVATLVAAVPQVETELPAKPVTEIPVLAEQLAAEVPPAAAAPADAAPAASPPASTVTEPVAVSTSSPSPEPLRQAPEPLKTASPFSVETRPIEPSDRGLPIVPRRPATKRPSVFAERILSPEVATWLASRPPDTRKVADTATRQGTEDKSRQKLPDAVVESDASKLTPAQIPSPGEKIEPVAAVQPPLPVPDISAVVIAPAPIAEIATITDAAVHIAAPAAPEPTAAPVANVPETQNPVHLVEPIAPLATTDSEPAIVPETTPAPVEIPQIEMPATGPISTIIDQPTVPDESVPAMPPGVPDAKAGVAEPASGEVQTELSTSPTAAEPLAVVESVSVGENPDVSVASTVADGVAVTVSTQESEPVQRQDDPVEAIPEPAAPVIAADSQIPDVKVRNDDSVEQVTDSITDHASAVESPALLDLPQPMGSAADTTVETVANSASLPATPLPLPVPTVTHAPAAPEGVIATAQKAEPPSLPTVKTLPADRKPAASAPRVASKPAGAGTAIPKQRRSTFGPSSPNEATAAKTLKPVAADLERLVPDTAAATNATQPIAAPNQPAARPTVYRQVRGGLSPIVRYLLSPLAAITTVIGIVLIVIALSAPTPVAATEVQMLKFQLHVVTESLVGGMLMLGGLLIFAFAAFVQVSQAVKRIVTD